MNRFRNVFKNLPCVSIGMIHVRALPGTPKYSSDLEYVIEKCKYEADMYSKHKIDAVLIENMHDIPYIQSSKFGPEIVACMTRIATEVTKHFTNGPCGIQILACGNKEAIAVAKAANLQFIRAEGYVFGHVADEGYTNACAGDLLRYRRSIDADNVLILTDIKKKHSSHSITSDISLLETVQAAEFFLSDGVIITGSSTGKEVNLKDLQELYNRINVPLIIGSGVSVQNLRNYVNKVDGLIVGSSFKQQGKWENELCEEELSKFMETLNHLRRT